MFFHHSERLKYNKKHSYIQAIMVKTQKTPEERLRTSIGFTATLEMLNSIEKAVENNHYHNKSALIREGVQRILNEIEVKEKNNGNK